MGVEQAISIERSDEKARSSTAVALWIALVAALSVAGSLAFACAAPLAAIAALAGTKMRAGDGLVLVIAAWLANQLVGYFVLDYPQTWDSFGWGAAIGVATVLGFVAASAVAKTRLREPALTAAAFAAAFAAYEIGLFAATAVLPSEGAFALPIVAQILLINAAALAGLLILHRAAVALHLVRPERTPEPAAA